MATARTIRFTALLPFVLSFFVLLGVAGNAQASTLTVFFSGNIDLTASGGPLNSTYSGFFTWDPAKTPLQPHPPTDNSYLVESYQLILNGVDRTLPPGSSGLVVGNDSDLNDDVGNFDDLLFLARLDNNVTINGVTGHTLFVLGFLGDKSVWNTLSLPTDYSFLSLLSTRFSGVSLEVTGPGEDVMVGEGGTFVATPAPSPVPEPATLTLAALGLAGVVTRARRGRLQR